MDIYVISCREMACLPGHSVGPLARKNYLFHYIISGRGVYIYKGKRYELHAGQGFLIYPNDITTYIADEKDPWHYVWIGFSGYDAEALVAATGIREDYPIFTVEDGEKVVSCLRQTYQDIRQMRNMTASNLAAAGGALRFAALICPAEADAAMLSSNAYYEKAMWYIHAHLDEVISIVDIASFVGLSRSQLFRAFKQVTGRSPSAAVASARVESARMMLKNKDLTVKQVAASCGYINVSHFCTAFKRAFGVSPLAFQMHAQKKQRGGKKPASLP